MSDRSLGFSVMLFLIVFVFFPALYLSSKALAPANHRTVVFDSINTGSFLRIQDPVRVNGFEAGIIHTIMWDKGKTLVTIETARPLTIHRGYSIIAEAKGFMGDRYLEIDPGPESLPAIDKNEVLKGVFPLGPTEAIAFMGHLGKIVDSMAKITDILENGSEGKLSFVSRFHSVTRSLDSIAASLSHVLNEADRIIGHRIDSLVLVLQKADSFSRQVNAAAPETIATLESVFVKTDKLLVAADTLVANADRLINEINGPDVTELAVPFNKLKSQIESLRNFLNQAKNNGVDLPVTF
jgi:ABC-type transporter Mla subunit MlaD